MAQIKQAVIPIAGLGTRFLPLSKILAKELFPLAVKPTVQYIIEEAQAAGIKKIVFVTRPGKQINLDYFKEQLKEKNITFCQVFQKQPLGDGHAVLQAEKIIKKEPCLVLFGDDIVDSKIPCSLQLAKVFNKYKKTVIALYRLPKEKLSSYGIVRVEKIRPRLYKIKDIIEKPSFDQAPSNLAVVGKYIIDSQVFDLLKNTPSKAKGEIRLAGAFNEMLKRGKTIYGYEFEGKWLECGNKEAYLKSNLYFIKKLLKEKSGRGGTGRRASFRS